MANYNKRQNTVTETTPSQPETTSAPVQSGNFTNVLPEFGRWQDVKTTFGIKRGTAYNLLSEGKIRGVLLRVKGKKSGVRLFDMGSVRSFIFSQMDGGLDE